MLDPSSTWSSTFNALPKTADASWAANMADAVDSLTSSKLTISTIKTVPAAFVFGKSAFKSALEVLVPVDSAAQGASNFAGAWEKGLLASTMTVTPGASVGLPATPANIFSAASSLVDPPSITSAKAGLVSALTSIVPSETADAFAEAFRTAFLALTCSTTGMNSIPPPGGPTPLNDPFAAVE